MKNFCLSLQIVNHKHEHNHLGWVIQAENPQDALRLASERIQRLYDGKELTSIEIKVHLTKGAAFFKRVMNISVAIRTWYRGELPRLYDIDVTFLGDEDGSETITRRIQIEGRQATDENFDFPQQDLLLAWEQVDILVKYQIAIGD